MTGAILAVVIFAALYVWGSIERRRERRAEFERLVGDLQAEVEAMFVRLGEALLPSFTSAMTALIPATRAADAAMRAFNAAYAESLRREATDG